MYKNKKQAFTLVELIVVITILAILGTIAFIAFQGYSSQARDSKRLSDIQNIKKSLELFSLNTGKYPLPDDGIIVSYSGDTVWTQGLVGNTVQINLSKNLNSKPLDPLTETEYTYSTTYSQTQYELLSVYESELVSYNDLINNTKAVNLIYPKIDGNYNQVFVKTSNYYIPTPSIINAEASTGTLILDNNNIKSQIITGGPNNKANGLISSSIGGLDGLTLQAFSGTISENSDIGKIEFVESLKLAYTGCTILANSDIYKEILETTSENYISLINNIVLKNPIYIGSGGGEEIIVNNKKSVSDCETSGTVIYGTEDGTDTNLTCNDDIIVCSGNGTGYIIAACNAGATTLYTNQTFPSSTTVRTTELNSWAGGLYQWGNNADLSLAPTSGTQIGVTTSDSTYSNSIFITGNLTWTSIRNDNLWGDDSDTLIARKGPCEEGYHVPTEMEWNNLFSIGITGTDYRDKLRLPTTGNRDQDFGYANQLNEGRYWSSTSSTTSYARGFNIITYSNINPSWTFERGLAIAVRCFKN